MATDQLTEASYVLHPTALAWLLLEGFVRVFLSGWLNSLVYPVGAPLHSKGQKQAAKDVTTAAVNLVSVIHVAIAVSSMCSAGVLGPKMSTRVTQA